MSAVDVDAIVQTLSGPERARVEILPFRTLWMASRKLAGAQTLVAVAKTPSGALFNLLALHQGEAREAAADANLEAVLEASVDAVRGQAITKPDIDDRPCSEVDEEARRSG